jgi:hypothetical protein
VKLFRLGILFFVLLIGFPLNGFSAESKLPYQEIGSGVEYVNEWIRDVPWSIHVIKIDRQRRDLKFITTLGQGKVYGLSSITDQIDSIPSRCGHAVAAINGDFFSWKNKPYQGDPRGLQIIDGELVSAPNGDISFWIEGSKPRMEKVISRFKVRWPDGTETPLGLNSERDTAQAVLVTPKLCESTRTTNGIDLILERNGGDWLPLRAGKTYSARVRKIAATNTPLASDTLVLSLGPKFRAPEIAVGMRLEISTATFPDVSQADFAIGGGPMLVHRGKVLHASPEGKAHVEGRNPRTAFGWNASDYFFVVVDGRRKNVSDGMTFSELANEMAALGCTEAMNLDGGGSSTIWAGGKVLNQPSDNHIRSVGNALICVRKN